MAYWSIGISVKSFPLFITLSSKISSDEPDSNQRPKDFYFTLQSSALPTELSSDALRWNSIPSKCTRIKKMTAVMSNQQSLSKLKYIHEKEKTNLFIATIPLKMPKLLQISSFLSNWKLLPRQQELKRTCVRIRLYLPPLPSKASA